MWFTSIKGILSASDKDLANDKPTNKLPLKPGPSVTATALSWLVVIFACFKAKSITGNMFF